MKPQIAIVMGSKSDFPTMKKATDMLDILGITYSIRIYSAHRTPDELDSYINDINECDECKAVIAGAGMSAALSGHIASKTIKPVIGVPLSRSKLDGIDALLSTTEMPPGIPVLSVGIDGAKNAALAAASIVALSDSSLASVLADFRKEQSEDVIAANIQLNAKEGEAFSSADLKFKCEF